MILRTKNHLQKNPGLTFANKKFKFRNGSGIFYFAFANLKRGEKITKNIFNASIEGKNNVGMKRWSCSSLRNLTKKRNGNFIFLLQGKWKRLKQINNWVLWKSFQFLFYSWLFSVVGNLAFALVIEAIVGNPFNSRKKHINKKSPKN